MKPSPRGTDDAQALNEKPEDDSSRPAPTPGERAGGEENDLPGGSYNVPPEDAREQTGD